MMQSHMRSIVKILLSLYIVVILCSSVADNYRQDGQGGQGGYSGSDPARYPGAGDGRGPGRDGFDRGGMMHRGRGGRGMG